MSRGEGEIGTILDMGPARVGEYPPGHGTWDAHPPATDTVGKQVVYSRNAFVYQLFWSVTCNIYISYALLLMY